MDFSKFSNEDLLALKANNYSKVSNEGLLMLKGQVQTPKRDLGIQDIPGAPRMQQPIVQAAQKGQELFQRGGEALAETLAGPGLTTPQSKGIMPTPIPGLITTMPAKPGQEAIRTSPETAAGIGTATQMVPEAAMAIIPGGQTKAIAKPLSAVSKRATNIVKTVFKPGEKAVEVAVQPRIAKLKAIVNKLKPGDPTRVALEESIEKMTIEKANFPSYFIKLKESLEQAGKILGGRIEVIEKEIGIGAKRSAELANRLKNSKFVNQHIDNLARLTDKGSKWVEKNLSLETIKKEKQFLQALFEGKGGKLTKDQYIFITRANKTFAEAMPKTAKLREVIGKLHKMVSEVPKIHKARKAKVMKDITVAKTQLARIKKTDKAALMQAEKNLKRIETKATELIAEGAKADLLRKRLLWAGLGAGAAGAGFKIPGVLRTVGGE